ncbi:hypothetical protein LPJ53_005348 [Coemansia erecta]|uniref:CCHC-type domain-containing protein n=1 Tax=Coemansia erecta TaxID=147472 RepID=A0A9W8CPY5_9FUNG|nr:hypothetical protein LPJ53_005348 [Coemansia erecta]
MVQEFQDYFKSKFMPLVVDDYIRECLHKLKQKGTILEYIMAETHIMGRYKMDDAEHCFDFMQGLRTDAQEYIHSQEPKTFNEMLTAAIQFELIKGRATVSDKMNETTMTNGFAPELMDVDAVMVTNPTPQVQPISRRGLIDSMVPIAMMCEMLTICAMTMGRNNAYQQGPNKPSRQNGIHECMMTILINGVTQTVSTCQAWVCQYIRDNNLCFKCGKADHIACQCPEGKEPGQQ